MSTRQKNKQKKWTTPQLTVLIRGGHEEVVMIARKPGIGSTPVGSFIACKGKISGFLECLNCNSVAGS